MENNIINILGVNISVLKKPEILKKIEGFLSDGQQHQIVTPNPEFILEARKDEEFFYILNSADLAVPDGIGLKFAAWAMGKSLHRFAGADLVKEILKIAEEKNLKVGVVNWSGGLSRREDIERVLKNKYPGLEFVVENMERGNLSYKLQVTSYKIDILFCTLGAPHQEKFIYHNLKNLPSVKIAIGVGGAFDFLTGKIKRAPNFLRTVGLEWLWRLILEPRYRIKRIYSAVIVFPCVFIKWRFVLPFLYRPNVACMIYKKERDKFKILLVERKNEPGHWQIPQGGTDGEDIERAGKREIFEETGIKNIKIIAAFKNLYKYKVPKEHTEYSNNFIGYGYKGQQQGLVIVEFLEEDKNIKLDFREHINWKWVDAENLINEVHPVRREAAEIFMEKFKNR